MTENPFFSITTPCFNSISTIERTLISVLNQSFQDYEYIIVDGGSTDGTMELIYKYAPLFKGKMKIKSEPDNGLYDAFNKGIARSRGIYCWNVNSDDYIEPDALEIAYYAIKNSNMNCNPILVGSINVFIENGPFVHTLVPSARKAELHYKKNGTLNHPAMIIPKTVYDEYGTYDTRFKIAADLDFFHRVYKRYPFFIYVENVLTNMSRGGVSNSFVYKKDLTDAILFMRKKYSSNIDRVYHLLIWHKSYFLRMRRQKRDVRKKVNK